MKRYLFLKIAVIASLFLLLIPEESIYSIPAFARKYQISCQVCHAPAIPRLKAFGEEFAANGFRMEKYESPRYFIETGDEKLSLFRELPLAVRFDGFATYNFDKNEKTSFSSPYVLKLLSGGELSDKLSYYFYFLMNEGGSIVGIEDAFLMYHDLFNTGINFYIGQFQASDPLFKGELRYTMEEYRIYDVSPGNSNANLKYERGIIFEKPFSTGTTVTAELLNGCGIDYNEFDTDKYKNLLFRVSQAVGDKVTVGFFTYNGKEALSDGLSSFNNKMLMYGPDIKINFGDKFIFGAQYVRRTDSEVYSYSDGMRHTDITTQGGFAEVTYSPKGDMSKWYLTGLFNWVDSDISELNYKAATIHAGYILRRNLRLVSEYTYQFSDVSHGRVNVGFVSAF
jgi:hypothetical protein